MKNNLASFIDLNSNKFMTITFLKNDGSLRVINGRLGVTKYLVGGKKTTGDNYITIYSLADKGYRNINKANILSVKTAGVTIIKA